ncbi:MAG TPA: hypothetical protein DC011_04855 [Bacteroidetes bacterium]|nr:MAG: gluconate 2-dehydrogenase subunit 3 family protein [Rhodothermaceae bacterium TMED105]HBD43018.1 hypothetical protein [Bacteroidota bacterium]|tara:strand:- start:3221 stop:3841 length:621 start_codon:yes stop_codon:yes gene_type:complete
MRKQEFNQSLSEKQLISRKEAIRRAGLMMGGFVFAPALTGVLNGCTPQAGEWTPVAFDKDQATTIKAVVDTIFPETDTPSASQAGIPGFIDELLTRNSSEDDQTAFMNELNEFMEQSELDLGVPFADAESTVQAEYLMEIHKTASGQGETLKNTSIPDYFMKMKWMTVVGYFTSEAGATQVLRYAAIPGPYQGCIQFEDVGRTWAT